MLRQIILAAGVLFLLSGNVFSGDLTPLSPLRPTPPEDSTELGQQIDQFLKKDKDMDNMGKLLGETQITLNFKGVPLGDAIAVLSRQAGINISLDKDVPSDLSVTSVYSGSSVMNALRSITAGMDLRYKKTQDGFLITPWAESYIDVNKVYQFGAGSQSMSSLFGGLSNPQLQQAGMPGIAAAPPLPAAVSQGGQVNSSVAISDFGGYMDSILSMIRPLLSKQGIVSYMPTGFIYVKDYPSRVKAVEELFSIDNEKREEVDIKITIFRIDYKKEHEFGISWSKLFEGFKVGSPSRADISGNFLSTLKDAENNVFSFGYNNPTANLQLMVKALSRYGNVKVVHSWETRAITGSVVPFDLTQLVWYSTGSIIQVVNDQTITTPQISNTPVGLSILLNPTKYDNKYLLNTSVKMSSVVSQQSIGELTFPNIENNAVSVPVKVLPGEQIVISGFKIKSTTKNKTGIPLLSSLPILEYLFGFHSAQDQTSEIIVVISLDKKKGEQQV